MLAVFIWEKDEKGGGWNDFKSQHTNMREAERVIREAFTAAHNTNMTRRACCKCQLVAQVVDLATAKVVFDSEESNPWALRLETRTPGEDWKVFAVGPSHLLDKPDRQAAWEWFAANCPTSHFGSQTESRVASFMDPDAMTHLTRTGPFRAVQR